MNVQPSYPALVAGNNDGLGMGGGGLLALALLAGRGGFGFGNEVGRNIDGGLVTQSSLSAQLAGVTDSIQNTSVMQTLGAIQGSIPLAEGQTQLAISNAQSDITSQNQAQTLNLSSQLFNGQLSNLAGFSNTKDAVDSLSTQVAVGQGVTNTNIERLGWQISKSISDDGERTRSLITNNRIAELEQQLTVAQLNEREERANNARISDRNNIEISMNSIQNQNQLQAQQQQQQIANLTACLHGVSQLAQATNQQLIIGNTGVASGGNQTSNPVNVRA